MKKIQLLLILPIFLLADPSFIKSKKQLQDIYKENQKTFYCGCNYSFDNEKNMIDKKSCGYIPRHEKTEKGKINWRARRLEWEHVMPAQNFGQHLPCWKEGGRKQCKKSSKQFKMMEADMVNLVPAIGELNGDRSNYRYGAEEATKGQYGACEFKVDFKARRVYVKRTIRGDIARIYFYMSDKYQIPLSKKERLMMKAWDKEDPIDEWEKKKYGKLLRVTK